MNKAKIRVLVVEDAPVVCMLLVHVLKADPQIEVIGTAEDGQAALEFVSRDRPDVVLMDVFMPKMDGFEATRRIMEAHPVPIVMNSASMKKEEVGTTFRALEAGALAFVEKPVGPGHPEFEKMIAELVQLVKLMSEVKVVRRRPAGQRPPPVAPACPTLKVSSAVGHPELVAMGASTGGPSAISDILEALPADYPIPVLIVQHITAGFLGGMIDWLQRHSQMPVQLAQDGVHPRPGHIYFAPDAYHMGVSGGGRIQLSDEAPENGLRPAVSHLFRSVANQYGAKAVGVLLTGMGKDGARELKSLRDRGAVTIAQDAETSVVHGMPGEAIRLNAATYVLPPDEIAVVLKELTRRP